MVRPEGRRYKEQTKAGEGTMYRAPAQAGRMPDADEARGGVVARFCEALHGRVVQPECVQCGGAFFTYPKCNGATLRIKCGRCRTYGAENFCGSGSQPLPFATAQGRWTGLNCGAP